MDHAEQRPSSAGLVHLSGLLRVLGTGSSGTVWLAANQDEPDGRGRRFRRPSPGRKSRAHAVKTSPATQWAASEQRILARLSQEPHPFIVPFLGAAVDDFKNYLVLEVSIGGDLGAVLLAQKTLLHDAQARVLIGCLTSAIACIHSHGLMYRDLKPENVCMVRQDWPSPDATTLLRA